MAAAIIESTIDNALISVTDQAVQNDFNLKKIDYDKVEIALYKGFADGITREGVHGLMDVTITPYFPERLDIKVVEEFGNVFHDAMVSIGAYEEVEEKKMLALLEGVELPNIKNHLEKNLMGDLASDPNIQQFLSAINIKLKEQGPLREPQAMMTTLIGVLFVASTVYDIFQGQETTPIILKDGRVLEQGNVNETSFPLIELVAASYKVAKLGYSLKNAVLIGGSARKLGLKSKEGIAKLARIKQSQNISKGLSGAAKHDLYKKQLRRSMPKPKVQDSDLKEITENLYKPNAKIGSGSTADALRYERLTGKAVGGRNHAIKAKQRVKNIRNWLKNNPKSSSTDKSLAEQMMLDLMEALGDI